MPQHACTIKPKGVATHGACWQETLKYVPYAWRCHLRVHHYEGCQQWQTEENKCHVVQACIDCLSGMLSVVLIASMAMSAALFVMVLSIPGNTHYADLSGGPSSKNCFFVRVEES
jgi:hypothetical protein